jgi:hypothetical protein
MTLDYNKGGCDCPVGGAPGTCVVIGHTVRYSQEARHILEPNTSGLTQAQYQSPRRGAMTAPARPWRHGPSITDYVLLSATVWPRVFRVLVYFASRRTQAPDRGIWHT